MNWTDTDEIAGSSRRMRARQMLKRYGVIFDFSLGQLFSLMTALAVSFAGYAMSVSAVPPTMLGGASLVVISVLGHLSALLRHTCAVHDSPRFPTFVAIVCFTLCLLSLIGGCWLSMIMGDRNWQALIAENWEEVEYEVVAGMIYIPIVLVQRFSEHIPPSAALDVRPRSWSWWLTLPWLLAFFGLINVVPFLVHSAIGGIEATLPVTVYSDADNMYYGISPNRQTRDRDFVLVSVAGLVGISWAGAAILKVARRSLGTARLPYFNCLAGLTVAAACIAWVYTTGIRRLNPAIDSAGIPPIHAILSGAVAVLVLLVVFAATARLARFQPITPSFIEYTKLEATRLARSRTIALLVLIAAVGQMPTWREIWSGEIFEIGFYYLRPRELLFWCVVLKSLYLWRRPVGDDRQVWRLPNLPPGRFLALLPLVVALLLLAAPVIQWASFSLWLLL